MQNIFVQSVLGFLLLTHLFCDNFAQTVKTQKKYLCDVKPEDIQRDEEILQRAIRCPEIHAPVCGSDGITYHNRCYLERTNIQRASEKKYDRFPDDQTKIQRPNITLAKWGPCDKSEQGVETTGRRNSGIPGISRVAMTFWEKECPYINKRDNCTPPVKSFCATDFPWIA